MRAILILSLLLAAPAAFAETRCGWLANPTPGNWWLTDADGDWVMMTQGGDPAPGMDLIPDLTQGEWVETNGSYGYGCACLEVATVGDRIAAIMSFRQLPLERCQADKALPGN